MCNVFCSRIWVLYTASFTEYVISMPNMYARGILWGKMVLELGDSCTARNDNNGFFADMQFKTKVSISCARFRFVKLNRRH